MLHDAIGSLATARIAAVFGFTGWTVGTAPVVCARRRPSTCASTRCIDVEPPNPHRTPCHTR
ncbi:hypothetical protein D7S86_08625 [Pararobbsia silviterrae]|uniref:Uncharacterized protein n=1 Tax=Pararobbsia silviterrae TaxID=1792498 RepID=A0A494Y111_9BURK|nr:hypothetical protein D7S86_08625 [Pararobbsia silviterrae]